MRLLKYIRSLWHQLMDLNPSHTAIVFHWDTPKRQDVVFTHRGIHRGEALHQLIDTLLEEHAGPLAVTTPTGLTTEIQVFWHLPSGSWEMDEMVSHYSGACTGSNGY